MLALSRGEGQSIIIDGRIEVKIVKWSRSSVRLAIQAPREITVDRDEIWRKMHPGELSPLEKAEIERRERFAREGAAGGDTGPAAEEHHHGVAIKSAVAGTFYASAGPGGNPFVSLGSLVEESTVVGSVKDAVAVHDIRAGVRGTITRILAGNGQGIVPGQVLFMVAPA